MVLCLPCVAATGFTGLSFLEGPLKDCIKISKPKQTKLATRKGMLNLAIRSPQSSLLARGGVKTPAVKPCIIDMTVSAMQRWFKTELRA